MRVTIRRLPPGHCVSPRIFPEDQESCDESCEHVQRHIRVDTYVYVRCMYDRRVAVLSRLIARIISRTSPRRYAACATSSSRDVPLSLFFLRVTYLYARAESLLHAASRACRKRLTRPDRRLSGRDVSPHNVYLKHRFSPGSVTANPRKEDIPAFRFKDGLGM